MKIGVIGDEDTVGHSAFFVSLNGVGFKGGL